MNEIVIGNNKSFEWTKSESVYVIGMAFLGDQLLRDADLLNYFSDCHEKQEFQQRVSKLNGFYTIILNLKEITMIASDRIRSFPLFYMKKNENYVIADDLKYLEKKDMQKDSVNEFLATGFVTNNYTLYRDIYQIENSACIFIEKNKIEKVKYSEHEYKFNRKLFNDKTVSTEAFEKINSVNEKSISRLIKFLDGRTAVVPLSGGHDSRVIAYYLKKLGYKKVITYTYGMENNAEAKASELVAKYLGFQWYFIPYENKNMQSMFNDSELYSEVAEYCGKGFSVPHIQEWNAMEFLVKNGIIDKTCVVIPGFTGDFLTGGHIPENFMEKKEIPVKALIDSIITNHYKLYDWKKNNENLRGEFQERIVTSLNLKKGNISNEEAITLFEKFDFQERQVKFISNAVRIYEFYGLEWYMPFWDNDQITFWLTVPFDKKFNRELFQQFTNYEYKELMDYAPIHQTPYNKVFRNMYINNIAKISRIYTTYKNHFINYYGYLKFSDYLYYVLKYKTSSYYFMFSHKYITHLKKK